MNLTTTITLYLFSSLTLTAALPNSDLQARGFFFRKLASALGHCDNSPDSRSGNTPLKARGGRCSKPKVVDSPSPSESPSFSPKVTYICRNKLPQCGVPHGPFCEKHCECSMFGDITCEKRLPAYPITVRQHHKQEREALCTKACHCEMVERYPRNDLIQSPGLVDRVRSV